MKKILHDLIFILVFCGSVFQINAAYSEGCISFRPPNMGYVREGEKGYEDSSKQAGIICKSIRISQKTNEQIDKILDKPSFNEVDKKNIKILSKNI